MKEITEAIGTLEYLWWLSCIILY